MRTVRYDRRGGPEVLTVREVDVPEPAPGQVRLRVEVVAGSFVDTAIRAGTSAFASSGGPGSPHGEAVGIVDALGPGAPADLLGRRVAALVWADAYAEAVLVDAEACAVVPAGMPGAEASVLAMAAPVALLALTIGQAAPGETVLVTAAAGSIGHLAVQLARLLGAGRVIGVVGSAPKGELVRELGASAVVLGDGWDDAVRALVPAGPDVVLDSIGGDVSATGLALLAPFGRLVVYGAAGGRLPSLPGEALLCGTLGVFGFGFTQWSAAHPHDVRRHRAMLTGWLAAGELRVVTHETVPLDEAPRAHALLADRSRVGRVLVAP